MVQNQHELLNMIAAGTINAQEGVHLLQSLNLRPQPTATESRSSGQTQPIQTQSPHQTRSGKQLPWLNIQVPVKNL